MEEDVGVGHARGREAASLRYPRVVRARCFQYCLLQESLEGLDVGSANVYSYHAWRATFGTAAAGGAPPPSFVRGEAPGIMCTYDRRRVPRSRATRVFRGPFCSSADGGCADAARAGELPQKSP